MKGRVTRLELPAMTTAERYMLCACNNLTITRLTRQHIESQRRSGKIYSVYAFSLLTNAFNI